MSTTYESAEDKHWIGTYAEGYHDGYFDGMVALLAAAEKTDHEGWARETAARMLEERKR